MFKAIFFSVLTLVLVGAREVVELQTLNFELTITSYQYLAILFYDGSERGVSLENNWVDAVALIKKNEICTDCEIAKVKYRLIQYHHYAL
jgi:hypothetical protein